MLPVAISVTVGFLDIWKAHNGRLAENWVNMDILGILIQLGAIPAPARCGSTATGLARSGSRSMARRSMPGGWTATIW
mgnify:CR=1 FL=1